MIGGWVVLPATSTAIVSPIPPVGVLSNANALGLILYTRYAYLFHVAGLILLVAMIGAIVLTLRSRPGVRHQSIAAQIARTPASATDIKQVPTGQGI